MSNNKFYFEFKNKTPKIQDFFPSRSSFYSLKSRVFYLFNFFSNRIKVKIPNLKNKKNKKLRELLNFSLLFSHVHHIFPTQTFLYITTPLSNTHLKKKLQPLLISKIYHFYFFENKKFPNYNRCKLLILEEFLSTRNACVQRLVFNGFLDDLTLGQQ